MTTIVVSPPSPLFYLCLLPSPHSHPILSLSPSLSLSLSISVCVCVSSEDATGKSSGSEEDRGGRGLDAVPPQSGFVMGHPGQGGFGVAHLGPARPPIPQYCNNQFDQYNQLLMAINLEMFRKSLLGQV